MKWLENVQFIPWIEILIIKAKAVATATAFFISIFRLGYQNTLILILQIVACFALTQSYTIFAYCGPNAPLESYLIKNQLLYHSSSTLRASPSLPD